MSDKVQSVGDDTFEQEVLQSSIPVLVDFWAEWCAPCRMLSPTVDAIADKYLGKVKVVKVNVDNCDRTSARYNIRSIPTLLLFKDGVVREQMVGATSKENIAKMIDNHL